ncbi:MAG: fatty acid desaturase [Oligoflexia bacterium]|nr:fatty acid desaturase [Oligoflexia bacterium]
MLHKNSTSQEHSSDTFHRLKFQSPDSFHRELQSWWHTQRSEGLSPYADWKDALKGIFFLLIIGFGYFQFLQATDSFFRALLWSSCTSLAALLLVFNFGHDASHGAVFKSQKKNYILNRILFFFLGIDGFLWTIRHLRAHHPYTNVIGADPDVSVGKILRVSPNQKHLFFHNWQPYYAPILYLLALPAGAWMKDFRLMRNNNTEKLFGYRMTKADKFWAIFFKILHLGFWILVPYISTNISLGKIFVIYFISMALSSATFIVLAALNHFSEYAEFPEHVGTNLMPTTWSEHQLRTNTDWCANSHFISYWVGGANAHVAHHLFPNLASRHLVNCTKEISKLAEKRGLPYTNLSFIDGLRSHIRFLVKLSSASYVKEIK